MKIKQVLFDGKCGLCNKEIHYYQSIAPKGKFKWVDITIPKNLARYPSINLRDALMNLHVVEGKSIKSGVDAFISIWSDLGNFKLLGFFISLPVIYQFACFFYRLFANYRFKNLSHCQIVDKQK
jgi:predicted DCC family thiol-disulfide oxidoreductase YuxK